MKIYKCIEMYVEKYLCKNIKENVKAESLIICKICKRCT